MEPLKILFVADAPLRDRLRAAMGAHQLLGETPLSAGVRVLSTLARELSPELLLVGCEAADEADALLSAMAQVTAELPALNVVLVCPEPLSQQALLSAMRAGVREVAAPAGPDELVLALDRAAAYRDRLNGARTGPLPSLSGTQSVGRPGEILVVHGPKGGAGRSVLACNLAVALSRFAHEGVVLVDLASQFGDQDLLLNLEPASTLGDLAAMEAPPDTETVIQALAPHASGIRLLSAVRNPEDGEALTADRLAAILATLRQRFRWVVVDTDSTLTEPLLRALELADRVLCPFFLDLAQLRRMKGALALWERLGIDVAKIEPLAWTAPGELDLSDAARVLKRGVGHAIPADAAAVHAAVDAGEPLVMTQPQNACAAGVLRLARELAGIETSTALVPLKSRTHHIAQMWRWFRSLSVHSVHARGASHVSA